MYQQCKSSQRTFKILRAIPLVLALLSRNCPLWKPIKQLFSSFFSLFFLFCSLFHKDSVRSLKIWNLFLVWNVNSLNIYHNQYLHKLLIVSFSLLIFVVYLVTVRFIILFKNVNCLYRQLYYILASFQK